MPHARLVRIKTREQRRPRGTTARRVVKLREAQPARRELVEIRRGNFRPVAADVGVPHVVRQNDDDVRLGSRLRDGGGAEERKEPLHPAIEHYCPAPHNRKTPPFQARAQILLFLSRSNPFAMFTRLRSFAHVCATLALALVAGPSSAADAPSYPFRVTMDSQMVSTILGKPQNGNTHTEFEYTWIHQSGENLLVADAIRIKADIDGLDATNLALDRTKYSETSKGVTKEVSFEKAPPELQQRLQDTFTKPVLKRPLDERGTETKRLVTNAPGAKEFVTHGMVSNCLLFHPTFAPGQTEWQTETHVSMGNGGSAKGKLSYKKIEGRLGDVYAVTGTLTNDRVARPGTPIVIRNAVYVVTGEQMYNAAQREWVSGKLKIAMTFEMTSEEKPVGSAKGTIYAVLERRP
jgi:hypothetical protein